MNGGVIVFDCERCRCNNITARLFAETVRLKDKILWADQDIFNLVFEGKIKLLPEKYNALRSVYENERQDDVSVVESWYIIHYNGKEKPWNASPYFKSYFWEYAEKTDFYTDLKEHLAASYSERIEVHEKHISFILRKINEYDTQGVKSMADRHIPFILGRINAYDHKEKVREDNHSEKKYFLLNLPLLRIKCSRMKKKYYLYFKGNVYDPTWRGVHGVAIADAPEGPFIVQDDYVFEFETGDNQKLNAEDPFVWYHRKDNCFYAVFKDFTGGFTKGEPGLAIMYAEDGIHWKLPEHSLFMNKEIILKNGERLEVDRLERPQLLLDENDEPIVLYSACSITPLNMKQDGSSFNIQIPILRNK